MSSAATTAQYPPALHGADDARPSLTRLAAVELRKMADTRAGLWLQISVALLTVLVVVITCVTGHAQDHSLRHIFDNAIQPAAVLLPIVGTLLVTSEWSQRTTLSTFALAAVDVLDPAAEDPATFALDVVSVIESTLEDPRQILAAQLNKARGEAVAAMKAEGIEYDERIELLDDVTYPRPLDELLGHTFEVYLQSNPWAADGQLSPKSVVREMWERAFTFREYVSVYGLTRSEGAVLRYLSDAFKALRSGVPAAARTEDVTDIVEWLGELVRQVDSSLLDEWEQLTSPDQPLNAPVTVPARPRPLTGNERAFTAMVRNALFRRVELFARRRWHDLGELDGAAGWTSERWEEVVHDYFAEHDDVGTGADARGPAMLIIDRQPDMWRVRQILDDPAGDHDWGFDVEVDLEASDEEGAAVIRVVDAGRMD